MTVLLPSTAAGSLRSRAAVRYRFLTAGPQAGAGAPGRVRLDRLIKFGTQFAMLSGLAALAAYLEGGTEMIASGAVNVAGAIGVAVGGQVGDSSPQTQALTSRLVGLVHE